MNVLTPRCVSCSPSLHECVCERVDVMCVLTEAQCKRLFIRWNQDLFYL